ncbi:hypothetical protein PIB30_092411 [Stylosanthes scabra]|uniref:Uncharacterized protein n=1 Tax=Stylosanthes scabra TaxID=79078 RepID=A0ABU6QVB6_9FABA|nr:hypothetical protein [Stylosanthes scabra]
MKKMGKQQEKRRTGKGEMKKLKECSFRKLTELTMAEKKWGEEGEGKEKGRKPISNEAENGGGDRRENKQELLVEKTHQNYGDILMLEGVDPEEEIEDTRVDKGKNLAIEGVKKSILEEKGKDQEGNEKKKTETQKKWKRRARKGEGNQQGEATRTESSAKRKI